MSKIIVDLNSLITTLSLSESNRDTSSQKMLSNFINWIEGVKNTHEQTHEFLIVCEDSRQLMENGNPVQFSFAQIVFLWAKQHNIEILEAPYNRNIDSVYSLSKQFQNSIIVSSDPRATIALTDNTTILKLYSTQKYGRNELFDETNGLRPSDMPLFLSLIGAPEFGIEPIAGVSNSIEVTKRSEGDLNAAISFAKDLRGFDFAQIARSPEKLKKNLLVSRIKEIQINEKNLSRSFDPQAKAKIESFLNQSFTRSSHGQELPDYPVAYQSITTPEHFAWLKTTIANSPAFSMMFEKDSSGIFAAVISFKEGNAVIIPFMDSLGQTLDRQSVTDAIREIIDTNQNMVTFSASDISKDMANLGIKKFTVKADVACGTYLLDTRNIINDASELSTESKISLPSTYDFCKLSGGTAISADQQKLFKLCSIRSDLTWKKTKSLFKEIVRYDMQQQYQAFELRQSIICGRMGRHGLAINTKGLLAYKNRLEKELAAVNASIIEVYGAEVDVGLAADVGAMLDHFDLKTGKTGTGQRSINEAELKSIENQHPIVPLIIRGRSIKNVMTKQIEKLLSFTESDGILRFNVFTNSTLTSRLSIRDPDIQNSTADMRGYMEPRKGYSFVSFDYSQIEIRILAHASREPRLIQAFKDGKDVHRETAAEVFQIPSEEVSDEQRKAAKEINFGLIYGMSPFGLAIKLGVAVSKANTYIQTYFKRLPNVLKFQNTLLEGARIDGHITLDTGRNIYFPEINSNIASDKSSAERSCKNAPMQATAAEIVKRALVKAQDMIDDNNFDANIVLQVHDELVFEVKTDQLKRFVPMAKNCLESALQLSVPLEVDVSIGQSLNKKMNNTKELNSAQSLTF